MNCDVGRTRSGLKRGYTTGSCAAAAAKAAAFMLLGKEEIRQVRLMTPKGIELYLDVEDLEQSERHVGCSVQKYSGDDPDVTNGMPVRADVFFDLPEGYDPENSFREESDGQKIFLDGGYGVGRVTKNGLEQRPGQAAINVVPRRMIFEAVREMCRKFSCKKTLYVRISLPEGEKLAGKTFNARLGILGGLSILGTTGIVEPMSEKALTDTIWLEMKMLRESGYKNCYVVPGNYGMDFMTEVLGADPSLSVKCSNFVGETIDYAGLLGMEGILLIGHAGKFIKLAAGVMNTHSRQADCRMEVLAAHAAAAGADRETVRRILGCINTSEVIPLLWEKEILEAVMETVMERMEFFLKHRAGDGLKIGAVMFTNEDGILGMTSEAEELLEQIQSQKKASEKGERK